MHQDIIMMKMELNGKSNVEDYANNRNSYP